MPRDEPPPAAANPPAAGTGAQQPSAPASTGTPAPAPTGTPAPASGTGTTASGQSQLTGPPPGSQLSGRLVLLTYSMLCGVTWSQQLNHEQHLAFQVMDASIT